MSERGTMMDSGRERVLAELAKKRAEGGPELVKARFEITRLRNLVEELEGDRAALELRVRELEGAAEKVMKAVPKKGEKAPEGGVGKTESSQ